MQQTDEPIPGETRTTGLREEGEQMETEDTIIERRQTGIRILLALLFVVIFRVTSVLLTVVVLFELLYALITRQPRATGCGASRTGP